MLRRKKLSVASVMEVCQEWSKLVRTSGGDILPVDKQSVFYRLYRHVLDYLHSTGELIALNRKGILVLEKLLSIGSISAQ